ncbi:MAG: hypothetical protein IJ887_13290 [Prevotella sp.]|nr:hypothetical protein [Prevotella sp.]
MNTNKSTNELARTVITSAAQLASLPANTEAEIISVIDLGNSEVEIADGCSLYFIGGSLINGTLVGNNTSLYGDVTVECLAGSFATPVKASYLTSGDYSNLLSLLGLNTKTVILDKDYTLPVSSVSSISCPYVKYLIGEDIIIRLSETGTISSPFCLIVANELKYLGGITFDGKSKSLSGFIKIINGAQDSITVENVEVKNITNTVSTSNIKGIYIDKYSNTSSPTITRDCRIVVRNVCMSNLYQRGNGIISDGPGSVTSLQIYVDAGSYVSVDVDNCRFDNIHCYGSGGTSDIMYENAAGLFVQSAFWNNYAGEANTLVEISNIHGHNFGKRLVMTDCANVNVRNVFGTNNNTDFLCLVGLNGSDSRFKYASIENIRYEGVVGYSSNNGSFTFETAMRYTTAENIVSKVTGITPRTPGTEETGTNYPTFYPVSLQADDVTIRGVHMIGAQTVLLPVKENIRLEDVTYDDTEGVINSYSDGIFMPMLGSSVVIDGLKVKAHHKRRLVGCNYKDANFTSSNIFINDADLEFAESPSSSSYKTTLIEAQDWGTGSVGHRLNFTLKNCICRHSENFQRYPFRKFLGQWTLENVKFIYDTLPTSSDHLYFGGCFAVYNDIKEALTLKDITAICPEGTCVDKPVLYLAAYTSGVVGTQIHLSNIRSNCSNYEIFMANVCWDEYVDTTVNRYQYTQFGTAQKGFMVKDYSAGVKYVWSGTSWVALTV